MVAFGGRGIHVQNRGVVDTEVGYANGHKNTPTYEEYVQVRPPC